MSLLDGEDTWQFLSEVKSAPETRTIPVVVVTTLDDARKGLALGADVYATKPIQKQWLLTTLDTLLGKSQRHTKVLVVDDQDAARYIVRQFLRDPAYSIIEARSGAEGIDRARDANPDVILLDLSLGDMNGREVLQRLKSDPATARPPVIIITSSRLQQSERDELALSAASIVSKDSLSSEVIRESIRHARSHRRVGPWVASGGGRFSSSTTTRLRSTGAGTCWRTRDTPCSRRGRSARPWSSFRSSGPS